MTRGKGCTMKDRRRRNSAGRHPLRVLLFKTSSPGAAYLPPAPPSVAVPLGIIYLAASLRKAFGSLIHVEVESLSTAVKSLDEIPSFLKERRPDVLGVSSTLAEETEAVKVCRSAALINNAPTIVIGGPYATCSASRALGATGAHLAVLGEGEATLVRIVETILKGGSLRGIAGTASPAAGGNADIAPPVEPVRDLDSLPFPAWDLVPIDTYSQLFNMNDMPPLYEPYAPMVTSRGCPYRCSFCHNIFGKRFRARSPLNVIEEMELLHDRFGVREFHIVDDIFNFDAERLEAICNLIIGRGLRIALAFPNAIRGDILTRKQIRLLKRVGCYSITMALESASPRILKLMRKTLDIDKLARSVGYASSAGMITSCFAMVGYPSETEEEMEATLRWLRDSLFDFPRIGIATPFPGTLMTEHALRAGLAPRDLDPERAHFDLPKPGMACMETDRFLNRFHSGIAEMFQEPRRQERIASICKIWPTHKWKVYGFGQL